MYDMHAYDRKTYGTYATYVLIKQCALPSSFTMAPPPIMFLGYLYIPGGKGSMRSISRFSGTFLSLLCKDELSSSLFSISQAPTSKIAHGRRHGKGPETQNAN